MSATDDFWRTVRDAQRRAGVGASHNPDHKKEVDRLECIRNEWRGVKNVKLRRPSGKLVDAVYDGAYNRNGAPMLSLIVDGKEEWAHLSMVSKTSALPL